MLDSVPSTLLHARSAKDWAILSSLTVSGQPILKGTWEPSHQLFGGNPGNLLPPVLALEMCSLYPAC